MSNKNQQKTGKTGNIIKSAGAVSELLYPRICPVCGGKLPAWQPGTLKIHPVCCAKLRRVEAPFCLKCGKPLENAEQEFCFDCSRGRRSFESGHGLWVYDKISSEAVFLYKYGKKRELCEFFAQAVFEAYGSWIREISPELIVPVPVSREKLRSRGFNQAELIAELLAAKLDIAEEGRALVRVRSTSPQKELDPAQRRENIRSAFEARRRFLRGARRVLLIDDIYTTGNTVEYCTRALKKGGAERVWFLTLCIGAPF